MAAESSFDVVSKVDRQEVDNALNQAAKEVRQRFDFKNTDASIRWSGEAIEIEAVSEERAKAVLDVFQSKLVKRGVSLKSLDAVAVPSASARGAGLLGATAAGLTTLDDLAATSRLASERIAEPGPRANLLRQRHDQYRRVLIQLGNLN